MFTARTRPGDDGAKGGRLTIASAATPAIDTWRSRSWNSAACLRGFPASRRIAAQGTANLTVTITLSGTPPAPPTGVGITSVTIGTLQRSSNQRPSQNVVTSVFTIPANQTVGSYTVTVTFAGNDSFSWSGLALRPPLPSRC